jgi:hypothetical protein
MEEIQHPLQVCTLLYTPNSSIYLDYGVGGGSGGSLQLEVVSLSGTGVISSNGGNGYIIGSSSGGGIFIFSDDGSNWNIGGSGGRIAVFYKNLIPGSIRFSTAGGSGFNCNIKFLHSNTYSL